MTIEEDSRPWTRKHDMPGTPLIPSVPHLYTHSDPQATDSLQDLISICKTRDRLMASGSHWALSKAAVSDGKFVETHDPTDVKMGMNRQLFDVVWRCLDAGFMQTLASKTQPTYDSTHVVGGAPIPGISTGTDPGTYFVHFEAGMRIFELYSLLDVGDGAHTESLASELNANHGNPSYLGSWALPTMGGAGGQTVFGALTTGTHGGDFMLTPIADFVQAIHLVADGGKHYWIERSPNPNNPFQLKTDNAKLQALYGQDKYGGVENFIIKKDDDLFNAVVVCAGRFGVVYSVVMGAVRQFSLFFQRQLTPPSPTTGQPQNWEQIKALINDTQHSPLYTQPPFIPFLPAGATPTPCKFLQIVVNVTPQADFTGHLCSVTKHWNFPMETEMVPGVGTLPRGRAERGLPAAAGKNPGFNPDASKPPPNLGTAFNLACAESNFLVGELQSVSQQVSAWITSSIAPPGGVVASVAAAAAAGVNATLPGLIPAITVALNALDQFINSFIGGPGTTRLGENLQNLANTLNITSTDPATRAGGLFVWQCIGSALFSSQQGDQTFSAISYAVMDGWDYTDHVCDVNVDCIEIFFDATDPALITFVDMLLAFEINQEMSMGKVFAGYISLRFVGQTNSLLGMEQFPITCAIEIGGLADVTGTKPLIDAALALATSATFRSLTAGGKGAIVHWGQRNDFYKMSDVETIFGDSVAQPGGALGTWRKQLAIVTDNGRLDGFSSTYTRQMGLEVVTPTIFSFASVTATVPAGRGGAISLSWNCFPALLTSTELECVLQPQGSPPIGASSGPAFSQAHEVVTSAVVGRYDFVLTAKTELNGELRTASKTLSVTVQ